MSAVQIELITPDGPVYEGNVDHVTLPGALGSFAVYRGHAPLISLLLSGAVKIIDGDKQEQQYHITGGVAEALNDRLVVLAEKAWVPGAQA